MATMKHLKLYAGIGLILVGTGSLFMASTGAIASTKKVPKADEHRELKHIPEERREGDRPTLSPEALAACSAKVEGAACSVTTLRGALTGTCGTPPGQTEIVCMLVRPLR
jgi:hypothetical protein